MVARQFGFVISRALAVFSFLYAIGQLFSFLNLMESMRHASATLPIHLYLGTPLVIAVYIVLATVLWTGASGFAGPQAEESANLRGGDWVIRLVLCCLGGYIAFNALGSLPNLIYLRVMYAKLGMPEPNNGFQIWTEVVKFAVGLGLALFNRFDRRALNAAWMSTQPADS